MSALLEVSDTFLTERAFVIFTSDNLNILVLGSTCLHFERSGPSEDLWVDYLMMK
jgi:hypothetical protein